MKRASYRRRLSRSTRRDTQPRLVVTGTNNLFARSKRISENSCQAARRTCTRFFNIPRLSDSRSRDQSLFRVSRRARSGKRHCERARHNLERKRTRRDSRILSIHATLFASRATKRSIIRSHNTRRYLKLVARLINRIYLLAFPR